MNIKANSLFLALAASIAGVGTVATVTAAPPASETKLYTLDCGSIEMPPNMLDRSDSFDEDMRFLPVPCYLIRHPEGDLMWDTGLPDALKDRPIKTPEYRLWVNRTLKDQLDEIGVSPDEIDYLALSHSHNDHAGNAQLFTNAIWLIDKAEIEFAKSDFAKTLGEKNPFARTDINIQEINSDVDVFGDGVVRLIQTPGHTWGHTSLLLNLENAGPILFSGDLYHFKESRERRLIPDFNYDATQTLASMKRFEEVAEKTQARVVIQHNPDDYNEMPKYPEYLN